MRESMEVITTLIGSLGFPIFVAVWLLMRSDKIIAQLTSAVHELTTAIKHKD